MLECLGSVVGEFAAQTNFASVFDGMTIVLGAEDGAELARQAYIYHQSPYAPDRRLELPPGPTTEELRFPLFGFPSGIRKARVRLEGGLPGTPHESGLSSNEVSVEIPVSPPAAPATRGRRW